jgi:dihydrofolate reductase
MRDMGRLVVTEFVTLDGVMEDPGGAENFAHGGWVFRFDQGPDGPKFKLDELQSADALLLGRVTYEGFAAAWPERTDEAGFADRMNGMPKYVVSNSLESPAWNNTTVLRGDPAEEVAKLRDRDGELLVAGSASLVHLLQQHDLVDEYRLMVFPILLGAGKRLFAEGAPPARLKVAESRIAGAVQILVLHPDRDAEAGG